MYVKQPKKLLILNILDILWKYTDEDHRLSQKEIGDILKNEYDMKTDRKAIRRNLMNLMDRIRDICILGEPGKPFSELKWSGSRELDLEEYMKEHVYMYFGENVHVKFRIVKPMITDVIDMFGKDVIFSDEDETHVTVSTKINERAMEQFARNFAPDVEVLQPESMREKLREELERAAEVYR